MGLWSFLTRRLAGAGTDDSTPVVIGPPARAPLTPEQLADLEQAWAELAQAAEGTGATGLHACTRNGKPWEEDPVAVRALAATLRDMRDEDTASGSQPAP